jgi:hypothetical protein
MDTAMTVAASIALAMALALAAAAAAAQSGHAHQHGLVRVDVAIDGPTLAVSIEAPLDSLVGFEHRPRTASQRTAAEAAITRLKDGAALWRADAAARCSLVETALEADALRPAATSATAGAGAEVDHADLDARYVFRCAAPAQLKGLEHGLFDAFPRIQRIEVQVAGPRGQLRQSLRRPAGSIVLAR